jgi:hypothetical protein
MHALFFGQSEFKIHSGLQPIFGSPKYSGLQLQNPFKHSVLGPHLHMISSFCGTIWTVLQNGYYYNYIYIYIYIYI